MNILGASSLTLIVDRDISALEKIRQSLTDRLCINIGTDLSEFLLIQSEGSHSKIIRQWVEDTLRGKAPGPLVCSGIDLLFEPMLQLDPLVLFRQISRHTKLIVLWPGEHINGVLSYATPGHHHYRYWKNLEDVEIIGGNDALQ